MLKSLAVISALALSAAVAHADSITPGSFLIQSGGLDQFTSSSIEFNPGTAVIGGPIGGTFNTYLEDGDSVNFLPGTNPYTPGTNVGAPGGALQLFSVTGNKVGSPETFTFFITNYSAMYVNSTDSVAGCTSGDTCLLITGNGYFTGSGADSFAGQQAAATFQFGSSYVGGPSGQAIGSTTSFEAQAATIAPTPEPASLALLGTGLVGLFGVARRRFVHA